MIIKRFLSTPSAGRATLDVCMCRHGELFLSTPSAGRATPPEASRPANSLISIHALRGEGDTSGWCITSNCWLISIHALRGEGDGHSGSGKSASLRFLSTPSAGRATNDSFASIIFHRISIHALRGEGDSHWNCRSVSATVFLSTPSAGRATRKASFSSCWP